ncbi:MAG: metallophosphoesterase [Clostridia bacterium]|nr:metallophosphoesterase [Clostridia bacterium]
MNPLTDVVVQRASFADDRRILMISDLHGHADGLQTLLKRAHFDQKDILVIVGDFVEKGPASLKTVRYVMQLCQQYTVYPLLGNVDKWRLQCIFSDDPAVWQDMLSYSQNAQNWWGSSFLGEMYAECGWTLCDAPDVREAIPAIRERFSRELAFLAGLPTILETQNFLFVHGGIPHERIGELEGTPNQPLLKRDHFMDEGLSFDRYVVVGHWPTALYTADRPCCKPIIDHERHIISLDGGCGVRGDGQLNLVIIPDRRSNAYEYLTWDALPRITALDAQEASAECIYIRWGEDAVEVLEQLDGMKRILRKGREMIIPDVFFWEEKGKTYCSNYTDCRLQVDVGETLTLIKTTPCGCYVKKDSCIGWYTGRYQNK